MIVSRDFEGLQMILMNGTWVPGVPLKITFFTSSYCFLNFKFAGLSFINALSKPRKCTDSLGEFKTLRSKVKIKSKDSL